MNRPAAHLKGAAAVPTGPKMVPRAADHAAAAPIAHDLTEIDLTEIGVTEIVRGPKGEKVAPAGHRSARKEGQAMAPAAADLSVVNRDADAPIFAARGRVALASVIPAARPMAPQAWNIGSINSIASWT